MPVTLRYGDITRLSVSAIVNAANRSLLGGGGVDGCIHRAAGPDLLAECRLLGGCETGQARLTGGYHLPAAHVIHTVGPVWHGGTHGEEELLRSCYRESFAIARAQNFSSLAFPLISAGVYGYPKAAALTVALQTIGQELSAHNCQTFLILFQTQDLQLSPAQRVLLAEAERDLSLPPLAADAAEESFSFLPYLEKQGLSPTDCCRRANLPDEAAALLTQPSPQLPLSALLALSLALQIPYERFAPLLPAVPLTDKERLALRLTLCAQEKKETSVFPLNAILFFAEAPQLGLSTTA